MTLSVAIKKGMIGGIAGGIAFGILMGIIGMLPMVAKLVGSGSAVVGFGVHLVISALIGAGYGVLVRDRIADLSKGLLAGAGYGFLWWILGPLTLMPLMLGMGFGTHWTLAAATKMLPSLVGHLGYGLLLAAVYRQVCIGCGCSEK